MINEFKSGIIYTAIGKYSNVFFQLIITSILARLLSPQEYGVVTVVNVFIVFFTMIGEMGIGPAIIQNKELNKSDYEELTFFTILLGILIGALFSLLGFPASYVYNYDIYIKIFFMLSLVTLFNIVSMVPRSILMKEKKFFIVNLVTVGSNIFGGLVSIILAINGFSYYSLIFGNIVKSFFNFLILFFVSSIKIRMRFKFSTVKKIYLFSKNQFIFDFFNYFSRNLDNLLIGIVISKEALAYYDKAYQLSLAPNQMLTRVVSPVVQPILSNYESDKKVIFEAYKKISFIFLLIGLPLTVFLTIFSKEIIFFLFGSQWKESIPIFRIFAVSTFLQMLTTITPGFFQSINRSDLLMKFGVMSSFSNVLAIIIGLVLKDIEILSLMLVISFATNAFISNYLFLVKGLQMKVSIMFSIFKQPLLICMIEFVLMYTLNKIFFYLNLDNDFIVLLISGILFILSNLLLNIKLGIKINFFKYLILSQKKIK